MRWSLTRPHHHPGQAVPDRPDRFWGTRRSACFATGGGGGSCLRTPIGEAIVQAAKEKGLTLPEAMEFKAVTGKGIVVKIDGSLIRLGNATLMTEAAVFLNGAVTKGEELAAAGKTPIYLARDQSFWLFWQ